MPQTTPPVLVTTSTASILTAVMSVDVTPAMREQGLTAKVYRSCFSPLECFTMFEMIHLSVFLFNMPYIFTLIVLFRMKQR